MNPLLPRRITKVLALFLAIVLLSGLSPMSTAESAGSIPIPVYVELNRFDTSNVGGDGASTLLWARGQASTTGSVLRVAQDLGNQKGTVVRRNKIQLTGGFSTYFVMELNGTDTSPADGMCFSIQSNATPELGGYGGGLGYRGILNSFGVEFDIWNNGALDGDHYVNDDIITGGTYNHVAIVRDGSNDHKTKANQYAVPTFRLSGRDVHVWVDYSADGQLTVSYGTTADRSNAQTLTGYVGTELLNQDVYVGFSASTGSSYANHDIKKWYFSDSYVAGGLSTDEYTYTQGASSVDMALNGDPTYPSSAQFLVKDASGQNMANQAVSIFLDGSTTANAVINTGASGIDAVYDLTGFTPGTHTLKAVASGSGGATSSIAFEAPRYEQASIVYPDAPATYGDAPFTHAASGGSGTGAFSYSSSNTSVATIDTNGLVTIRGAGTTTLTAIRAGDSLYNEVSGSCTLTVDPATLTPTATANAKTYDGTTTATGIISLAGIVSGDSVTASGSFTFADRNAGTGKAVEVTGIALSGADEAKYILSANSATTSATISRAPLTITADDLSKTYGGLDPAFTASYAGLQTGDDASVVSGLTFNRVTGEDVTPEGYVITPSGASADNYNISYVDGKLTIQPKPVSAVGVVASDKVYDGDTTAAFDVSDAGLTGHLADDDITLVTTGIGGAFDSINAGSNKTVAVSGLALAGTKANNYTLQPYTTTANIAPKPIPAINITAGSKIYDGTTASVLDISGAALGEGIVSGDFVTLDATDAIGAFNDKNVGTGKPVTVTGLRLSGVHTMNYVLQEYAITADISEALLAATVGNYSKVYGSANPSFTVAVTGFVSGETAATAAGYVAPAATSTATALTNVGTAEIIITGGTADNYIFDTSDTGILTIGPKTLTVTVGNYSKIFGEENPAFAVAVLGFANGETADTALGYSAPTASSTATVTSGVGTAAITIEGGAATNYVFNTTDTGTLTIAPKTLVATVGDYSKTYGNANPSFAVTVEGFVNGETQATAAGYTTPVASSAATVLTGVGTAEIAVASGTATNYVFDTSDKGVLTIEPKVLLASATAESKTYDGTTHTTGNISLAGVLDTDLGQVNASGTFVFSDAGAGVGKIVEVTAVTLSGTEAGNYTLADTTLTTTADISPALLTIQAEDKSKVYGEADPEFTVTYAGFVAGEEAEAVVSSLQLTRAAGEVVIPDGYIITPSDATAANYEINYLPGILTVTTRPVDATGIIPYNKYYDGTTTARLSTWNAGLLNTVAGDDVNLDVSNALGEFSDAELGIGKTVTVSGLALIGADAGNYVLNPYTTIASIREEPAPAPEKPAPTDPPVEGAVQIIINGEPLADYATATVSTEGEQTVTTITLTGDSFGESLQQAGAGSIVTIPSTTATDIVVGELNGQMVKDMELQSVTLEVKTERSTYTLPAEEINIDAVSAQLGENVTLADIIVRVEVAEPNAEQVRIVESIADQGSYTLVVPPLEFSISCTYGEQTVEVSQFNSYVERTVAIPEDVDPAKITTGVVVLPDGSFAHVPTKVVVIDGKYYAQINSLTNSTYTLIWNQVEFADVANHWARADVNEMASRLVVGEPGNLTFGPGVEVTRAEFAMIVVKALGLKPGTGNNPFRDVSESNEYRAYIETAYAHGIVGGHGNGIYGPNDMITREQAMSMITRAMKLTGLQVELAPGEAETLLAGYVDQRSISSWARAVAATSVKGGLIGGRNGGLIGPQDKITRAELAVVVRRLLRRSGLI